MPGLSGRLLAGALLAGVVCVATAQSIETNKVVNLRAVGKPSSRQVQLLARQAQPFDLSFAQFPDERATTPRRVISGLCGSVRPAYVAEVAAANGLPRLPLDQPLGEQVASFQWPACFYVNPDPVVTTIEVRPGDTAYGLYTAFNGRVGSEQAISAFFGEPIERLAKLKAGDTLTVRYTTATGAFAARDGDAADLVISMHPTGRTGTRVVAAQQAEGDIVVGMDDGAVAAGPDCPGSAAPPFDPQAVLKAYRFSRDVARREDINVPGGVVELVVVDNGFFGARAGELPTKAFEGSPFLRRFFKPDENHTIAKALTLGDTVHPINYANGVTPTVVSGHGTHVTGLVLGGPAFRPYLDLLTPDPWASVTILNVGRGERKLFKGASNLLTTLLRTDQAARIVNLSIAHDGRADDNVGSTYNSLFKSAYDSLFVAAAGNNNGADVGSQAIFPAAHGGTYSPNVITVAAIDAHDRLPTFSNRSASAVDLAAPGCRISSWIALDQQPVPMSGTSQAAPQVSFAAGLLRSIAIRAQPSTLKSRIVASGDLLPDSERGKTAFGVKPNVARSLFWFHDTLDVSEAGVRRRFLGALRGMSSLWCSDGDGKVGKSRDDMWSLKRSDSGRLYFFAGRLSRRVDRPCPVASPAEASVFFSATHEWRADGSIETLPTTLERSWPINTVHDLVVGTPLKDIR
jgi:hypothetical protein